MARPPAEGFSAHQDEPRTLGGRVPRLLAEALAHDRAFLDALEQQRPLTFEGSVTALQRDNTGVNRVQVQRTGQSAAEATWYTVWGTFYVPVVGDQVRMLIVGRGAAILLGAKHGGRPNEWTVAYSGGALHQYDSGRLHIHKHGDDHHGRHYRTDGATIAHHQHEAGHARHIGDHLHSVSAVADDGTPTGPWVRHARNVATNRYERYQHQNIGGVGEVIAHSHDLYGSVQHYLDDGTGTGTRRPHTHSYSAHTHPKGHVIGDDGTGATRGLLYLQHGGGNRALDHDGTQHRAWAYSGATAGQHVHSYSAHTHPKGHVIGDDGSGTTTGKLYLEHGSGYRCYDSDGVVLQHYSAGQVAHSSDGHTHAFYDLSQSSTAPMVHMSSRQTVEGTGGSGGHVAVKQSGTGSFHSVADEGGMLRLQSLNSNIYHDVNVGSGTASRHALDTGGHTFPAGHHVGDSGGHLLAQSQGANHFIATAAGTYTHTHSQHTHTFPSTAYHQAPTTDSSVVNTFTPGGAGAIKRASHSTTPQVVGTGSATISGHNINIAAYSFAGGAPGDPHLKLLMGCVWDSGSISNPGLYSHNPAAIISNTDTAYSSYVYNTAGGGTNTSYAWGTSSLSHDSKVNLYATKIGAPANLAVGTALWQHIVN